MLPASFEVKLIETGPVGTRPLGALVIVVFGALASTVKVFADDLPTFPALSDCCACAV